MSYILEALKKADAERDRGAVPDLHAQAMLPEAAFEDDAVGRSRPWLWLLAGVVLALIAGGAWQWMGSEAPAAETAATTAVPAAMPAAAAPTPPASMATSSTTALPASADGADRTSADAVPGAAQAASKAGEPAHARTKATGSTRTDAPKDKPNADGVAKTNVTAAKSRKDEAKSPPETHAVPDAKANANAKADTAPAPKASAKTSPLPAATERLPSLAELPDDVRRQVPALKLGGLVYSAAPASRMVIVNGDVQREGSTVAPGLTLDRINPKSAVFSLRGQRFEVPI